MCPNFVKVRLIRWIHRTKSVFRRTKSYPMEKKWRHDNQGLIQLGMCASDVLGDCGNLAKVRLSDGSDGSIGQACFPSDKELSDGEKMTSWQAGFNSIRDACMRPAWWLWQPREGQIVRRIHRTSVFPSDKEVSDGAKMTSWQAGSSSIRDVCKRLAWWLWQPGKVRLSDGSHRTSVFSVGHWRIIGLKNWRNNSCGCRYNLTSYGIDQSICSNSKLSPLKPEVSLRFLLIAKIFGQCSMFFKTSVFSIGQRVIQWRKNDVVTSRV